MSYLTFFCKNVLTLLGFAANFQKRGLELNMDKIHGQLRGRKLFLNYIRIIIMKSFIIKNFVEVPLRTLPTLLLVFISH